MDASWIKKSANSFWLAAARSFEERRLNTNQFQMLLIPGVVCLAFAAELGMKALIRANEGIPKIHNLAKLFVRLDQAVQDRLVKKCKMEREQFDKALGDVANVFEEWRYVYEIENPTIDLPFLKAFSDAVKTEFDAHPSSDDRLQA